MAHIAIDARKYFDYGIGSYIQNLASALSGMRTKHSFTLLAGSRDLGRIHPPEGWRTMKADYGKYSLGELAFLGRKALADRVDLFHEPHYTLPAGLKGRSVVTIHDLIHLKLPQYFSVLQRGYAREMLRHAVRHAGAIIAVSQKTKDDILDMFGVEAERVAVVHNGVRPVFRRIDDGNVVEQFRRSRSLNRPYILYVGNVKPHKNIPALLHAFADLHSGHPDLDLVFAGGSCLQNRELEALCARLHIEKSIRDLNQLVEPDLVAAYNGAAMVVLPSFYEGFGFPALESMACETPVIVSNAGALPEVVGNAATIVDPARPSELAQAMRELLEDSEKRGRAIAKGKVRAGGFSWQKTGEQTLRVYEKVLAQCRQN
jgi:glycosyltransferase involved in cell wall biosynthesis